MPRYILTGTPGAGKTAILRLLERAGYAVVEEAATDVIALEHALGRKRPEEWSGFVTAITGLQRERQQRLAPTSRATVLFDRSPVCTLALARFLHKPVPAALTAELDRMTAGHVYQPEVFFIRNQAFVAPTAARRISFEDSLAFERAHERAYCERGFRLIEVPSGPLAERAGVICRMLHELAG